MSGGPGWRRETARLSRVARPRAEVGREAPLPPPLPPGRLVSVPGRGEMFVREAPAPPGSPVILLLHGWTSTADLDFFPVYATAGAAGHLVALDHRGHGRGLFSEEPFTLEALADDAAALLAHLGLGPVVAVGYSMGGPVAMLLWRRHPEMVAGLVLAATALEWRASRRERNVWRVISHLQLAFRLGPPQALMERYLRWCVRRCPELAPWRGWVVGEHRRGDPSEVAAAAQALAGYDARPFAGLIDVPTAVIVTTADRLVRPSKQRDLAQAVPGALVVSLDGDHDTPLTRPGPFREAIATSLRSVLARLG